MDKCLQGTINQLDGMLDSVPWLEDKNKKSKSKKESARKGKWPWSQLVNCGGPLPSARARFAMLEIRPNREFWTQRHVPWRGCSFIGCWDFVSLDDVICPFVSMDFRIQHSHSIRAAVPIFVPSNLLTSIVDGAGSGSSPFAVV